MNLTHSCIITNDVKRLSKFYEKVLQIKGKLYGEDYAEFKVGQSTLAIFSQNIHESIVPGTAEPSSNKSVILEFHVENVDEDYKRLEKMDIEWVKTPTEQPWGTRSFYFRDIDGNLISFYTPIK